MCSLTVPGGKRRGQRSGASNSPNKKRSRCCLVFVETFSWKFQDDYISFLSLKSMTSPLVTTERFFFCPHEKRGSLSRGH